MPHTWIGAEYILAVRYLFAYEHHERLHLGQGIDPVWLEDGQAVSVKNLPTHYGELSYDVSMTDDTVVVDIRGAQAAPPAEGYVFYLPTITPCERVTVNGQAWKGVADNRVYFNALPVTIEAIR
ncbi:MAG: hypothetical protein EOM20_15430 [Spartobacteria bacterium]|nr:hypothetical protein [Spartobacteria bacterium]